MPSNPRIGDGELQLPILVDPVPAAPWPWLEHPIEQSLVGCPGAFSGRAGILGSSGCEVAVSAMRFTRRRSLAGGDGDGDGESGDGARSGGEAGATAWWDLALPPPLMPPRVTRAVGAVLTSLLVAVVIDAFLEAKVLPINQHHLLAFDETWSRADPEGKGCIPASR